MTTHTNSPNPVTPVTTVTPVTPTAAALEAHPRPHGTVRAGQITPAVQCRRGVRRRIDVPTVCAAKRPGSARDARADGIGHRRDADVAGFPSHDVHHSFRARHGDELSFDLVNDMLRDLNRIYRERERKQVARSKQQNTEELNKLKRKLTFRPTFDEVTAKRNKQTLKRQITAL